MGKLLTTLIAATLALVAPAYAQVRVTELVLAACVLFSISIFVAHALDAYRTR
jgi:hypothetical protein